MARVFRGDFLVSFDQNEADEPNQSVSTEALKDYLAKALELTINTEEYGNPHGIQYASLEHDTLSEISAEELNFLENKDQVLPNKLELNYDSNSLVSYNVGGKWIHTSGLSLAARENLIAITAKRADETKDNEKSNKVLFDDLAIIEVPYDKIDELISKLRILKESQRTPDNK